MPGCSIHQNAALVMAHPDDEVLWASSVLSKVSQIVLCFEQVPSRPEWGRGRQLSLEHYPLAQVTQVGLAESEVFNCADWPRPEETAYGLKVRHSPRAMSGFSEKRYRENHPRLIEKLRTSLAGYPSVITHNPWGEYGHEEHAQVFRAVAALRAEMGFDLWVNCYVSNRNFHLMTRHFPNLEASTCCLLPTDPDLALRLKALYTQNGCWTWFDDYEWPRQECFCRYTSPDETSSPVKFGDSIALNMLWMKDPTLQQGATWPHTLKKAGRLFLRSKALR
jgi:hypothetical protein